MKEYVITILLRADDEPGPEFPGMAHVKAQNEHEARRCVLERIYSEGLVVSEFLNIEEQVV